MTLSIDVSEIQAVHDEITKLGYNSCFHTKAYYYGKMQLTDVVFLYNCPNCKTTMAGTQLRKILKIMHKLKIFYNNSEDRDLMPEEMRGLCRKLFGFPSF